MSLSSTRGLVRVSKNPDCTLQAAMVIERVREPDFYRKMTGTEYPGEYGERASARRRGAKFEANLHMNDAALLGRAVAPLFGFDPEQIRVRNFDDEVPGARDGIRAIRLARTVRILRDLAAGRDVPQLLIQPQLRLPVGPARGDYFYVSPDFLVLDPTARIYVPGEEKSFIVRDGVADRADLELTRRQAAAQILALRAEAERLGIATRVLPRATFVQATPYGLRPAPAVIERLDGEVQALNRAINALAGARQQLANLRARVGDTSLENLADELPVHYQESCVGSCVLARICKDRVALVAPLLGDAAEDLLGPDFDLLRVVQLAGGADPANARERDLANQIRDAASVLELTRLAAR